MIKITTPFITTTMLSDNFQIAKHEARNIIDAVNRELKEKGCYIPKTREKMAPTELVLRKMNLKPKEYME